LPPASQSSTKEKTSFNVKTGVVQRALTRSKTLQLSRNDAKNQKDRCRLISTDRYSFDGNALTNIQNLCAFVLKTFSFITA
jgi:hypothetical protein